MIGLVAICVDNFRTLHSMAEASREHWDGDGGKPHGFLFAQAQNCILALIFCM